MAKTINQLTVTTSAGSSDEIALWRASNSDTRKITKANFIGATLTGGGTVATNGSTLTLPSGVNHYAADMFHKSSVLLVDANFTGNSAAKRYTTIATALAACTGGETILIAPGTYTENITVADNGITLVGSGQPYYDSGTGRLVGGTIIRGYIETDAVVGLTIRDLGVDLVGVNSTDCIHADDGATVYNRQYYNLTLLGNGTAALAHGIYMAGQSTIARNIRVYNCHHGIAIHGAYVTLSDLYFYSCYGTALVIKAKGTTQVHSINVNNVVMEGVAGANTRSGPIAVQAEDSLSAREINISNVTARHCINGVFHCINTDVTGTIANVVLTNITSYTNNDAALVGDFRIVDGDAIYLINCRSYDRDAGYGFEIESGGTATNIYLYQCHADGTGSGASSGAFEVREINGEYHRGDGNPIVSVGTLRNHWIGGIHAASISITGANTPVCSLTNASDTTTEYYGLLFVHARNGTGTASNSASYVLHVHRYYNQTGVEVVEISSAGLDSGAAAAYPSFTWTGDYTNSHLEATPIGSTSGTFHLSVTAIGNIKVAAL